MHLRVRCSREIRGEHEPACGAAILQELIQARFMERGQRLVELLHFGGINVDAHHGVAHGRQSCSVDCPEVAAADHGDLHEEGPLLEVSSEGPVVSLGTPEMTSL
ncbi:hypothetical protein PJL18_02813 [Paenarthrobacter nicotinovorans]|nr:hypothetical protein [Paenarthrobacter nicotinovorans]